MPKIHAMMDIGKRSMSNSQTALQTTAHNIANKSVEGFSRQRLDLQTNPSITEGKLQIGTGARPATVQRVTDPFLDKQLGKEMGTKGYMDAQSDSLIRIENIFNEQNGKGINQYVSDFFNAWREVSNNPESATVRAMVTEVTNAMTNDFARVSKQLDQVQEETDFQIKTHLVEINKITSEIAGLNERITQIEINAPSNDERDRRDLLVRKLQELVDIKVGEGDNGAIMVSTAGNAILVSGFDAFELNSVVDPKTQRVRVMFQPEAPSNDFDITDRIRGGKIGGIIEIRDRYVPEIKKGINEIASVIAKEVNAVHELSYDSLNRKGKAYFIFEDGDADIAQRLRLNPDINNDGTRIAAASRPNAPGDNASANVISMLQFKRVLDGGTTTMDDFYNAQVGKIGVSTFQARKAAEAQTNVLQQAEKLRESISGVSMDEEATRLIEFQKNFDASARVIRTADEMLETILNLKRL